MRLATMLYRCWRIALLVIVLCPHIRRPGTMAVSNATRPEHAAAADAYYDATEARKYTSSSRIIDIQAEMAQRCLELLSLPPKRSFHLLDIGCGSGLSGGEHQEPQRPAA